MADHTPDPWEVSEQIDYDQAGNKFIDGYAVFNKGGLFVAGNLSSADANFIAAAPEMLKALELVAKCSMYPGVAVKRRWSDAVFAAIAKAKGKT